MNKPRKWKRYRGRAAIIWLMAVVLAMTSFAGPVSVVRAVTAATDLLLLDNGDPGYAESTGWSDSSVKGNNGTSTRVTGGNGYYATWTPPAGTVQGTYKVSFFKVKRPTSTDDPHIKLDIVHGGATDTQYVDATQGTSEWITLGTFTFNGSGSEYVKLTKITTVPNTFVHADAVKFERVAANSDASLLDLQVNGSSLTPAFSPTVTSYTYGVAPTTDTISVTASVYDPLATIRINGVAVANGVPSAGIPLAIGDNHIAVTVTAMDGITSRTYTITVSRPLLFDATLSSLTLSAGTLTPAFSPATTDYSAEVDNQIASVKVTAGTTDGGAIMKVNGQVVQSGHDSQDIPLAVGANDIPIEVTGTDGATRKTYTVHVTRKTTNTIILDYGDNGYSERGTWLTSTTVKGYNNTGTRYTTSPNDSVTWKPSVTAGTAAVSFYKVNWPDKADPNVKVEIVHNGITETRSLDLTSASEGWVDLGTYDFAGNDNEYIRVTRVSDIGKTIYTRVDAVKFEGTIQRKPAPPGPLRSRSLPNLQYTEKGMLQNANYKAIFYEAVWDGGRTFVRDLYHMENGQWMLLNSAPERLEEQWVVLNGDSADRAHYYDTMDNNWITFDGFSMPDDHTVVLTDTADADRFSFTVTWSMADSGTGNGRPAISYAFTPVKDGNYVIGYQSFTAENVSDVSEVLSGGRNRAKMAGTVESTGLWELTAPMSLVEKKLGTGDAFTYGVYVPAEELPLQFEPSGTAGNQRLGMSLVNNDSAIQPILYAPQYGTYSRLTGGSTYSFKFGLYAQKAKIYDAYTDILRADYAYTDYRENVAAGSLNDAMYNMIDLIKINPQGDDSVNYVPSLSGWWNRAKGFVDIENQDSIRTAASSVLLGAYKLTGDDELYETRALPMLEHGVSRNERGWSPTKATINGDSTQWKMAAVPFDVSTISTFYEMTGGRNAGLYALGQEEYRFRNPDQFNRGPVIQPLMMYRMTGDASYLDTAKAAADQYIAQEIDTPSTAVPDRNNFFYNYGKLWVEILELYEETKDPKYLNAAYKEAKRYASIFVARPVPQGLVTIPQPSPLRYELAFRWADSYRYPYPRKLLPEDEPGASRQVESWVVSPNGLTFEAGSTSTAYRMNMEEAPFLLRLGEYTGDQLLKDIAHNAVIGRYSSYPGYYYRGLVESQQEPDFPLLGPSEGTSIYYHHVPAQLGQTMDYLMTEQTVKSNAQISFPSVFETDFLWFKYHVYGSQPGTFYGHPNVWLWMPKGIIDLGNKQLNWITGESGDRFYISLSNESHRTEQALITLNAQTIGFDPGKTYPVTIIRDNGAPEQAVMNGGRIDTSVSAQGITAIIVEGMNVSVPLHQAQMSSQHDTADTSYFFDTYSPIDAVKGMLFVKPDETSYDAYVQAKTTNPATLFYSVDGGHTFESMPDAVYPMEWSIKVNDLSTTFTYYVESEGKRTQTRTLYLQDRVAVPPVQPEPPAQRPFVVVDNVDAESDGRWARATAANDYYYDNYVTSKTTTSEPTSRMRWRPDLPKAGMYQVYYKLPAGRADWAPNAALTVQYDGGTQTYTVNQKNAAGSWVLLGTHPFTAGKDGYVELSNQASGSYVAGDAFMWVPTDYAASIDSVMLAADKTVLMRSQSTQLSTTVVWDTGVTEPADSASVAYEVDRPDLAAIDASGRLTLNKLDGVTDQIRVTAHITRGNTVVDSSPLLIPIRELSIIVDSTDGARYAESGLWKPSGLFGYNPNVKSRYTETQGATATWTPTLPSGKFTVSFYNIVRMPGGDPNVQLEVKHGETTSTLIVDGTSGASGWVNLGTYDFSGDGSEYVRVTRLSATPTDAQSEVFTRTDAVKFDEYSLIPKLLAPTDLTSVPVQTTIDFAFNHSLDAASVNEANVQLQEANGGAAVPVTLTLSQDGYELSVTPKENLHNASVYEVRLGAGLTDLLGSALSPYAKSTYMFTTEAFQPETTDPGAPGPSMPSGTSVSPVDVNHTEKQVAAGVSDRLAFMKEIVIQIPAGAMAQSTKYVVEKLSDPAVVEKLLQGGVDVLSPIFEITKDQAGEFNVPIKLAFTIDPSKVKKGQRPSIHYFDEGKKVWVDMGGTVNGDTIEVTSNHLTKFAVLNVEAKAEKPELTDIAHHWAAAEIRAAVQASRVHGYEDSSFRPDQTVSRAEFTVMLTNALYPGAGPTKPTTYTDQASIGAWAQPAIALAAELKLVSGYEDGSFRPGAELTRAQLAVMLAGALGAPAKEGAQPVFADSSEIPAWAQVSAASVQAQGLMQGYEKGRFVPSKAVTRAEAIVVINRLLKSSKQ
ncbi:cadherin-like beta sandwich domain-containing protein [Paenibacillus ferrarius]|uniref:golvesin C-terminal-like domain-containing protein n=1 Tax=Paenibacillus ferrarius TaxID=1469647 RepID=UPI003D273332